MGLVIRTRKKVHTLSFIVMAPKIKLTYFNAEGRAELTRMILAQAGVEFEDVRLTREEWAAMKPTSPWNQLPLLEYDGKKMVQSIAIARFLLESMGLLERTTLRRLRRTCWWTA